MSKSILLFISGAYLLFKGQEEQKQSLSSLGAYLIIVGIVFKEIEDFFN